MWNKIYKASFLKEIYFEVYDDLNEKNSFFVHEDCLHNILIFMLVNSFLGIEKNIIIHRLDKDRHEKIDNKNKIIFQIIYFNNLIKIIRNKKLIKNKSDDYKHILYRNLCTYIKQEIEYCNYFIDNGYNIKDYIKNIDIDPSIKFDNEKLIFEYENIL